MRDDDFICPQCGEPVPGDARCCPHCGSDDETGWDPDAENGAGQLPDEEDEAPAGEPRAGASGAFAVLLLVVALLGIIALYGFGGLSSPYVLFGGLVLVAVVVHYMRRRRGHEPPRFR